MAHTLYTLMADLDAMGFHYRLDRYRSDTVMLTVTVVGERVEIDVFDDGHVEFSRFKGNEDIEGEESELRVLLARFAAENE